MWSCRHLNRIDWRILPVMLALMAISLLVISSQTSKIAARGGELGSFITPLVKVQAQWFVLGWGVFFLVAGLDYTRLKEWTWLFYALAVLALVGLFFTDSIQRVHRWYRVPIINVGIQPSEHAKLVVVLALAWYLDRKGDEAGKLSATAIGGIIAGLPFALILKQPDLGSALVLFPITLVMFYFGSVHPWVVRGLSLLGLAILVGGMAILLGVVSHEEAKPAVTRFIKEYQYERLNPHTPHQRAAATAIAVGGKWGVGWRQGSYAGNGWLPYPYTDSVFPAFAEEFGLMGLLLLLALFYALIYFGFQVTAAAKDPYGRLLSAGVTVYLAMHILVNIGMMCGFLPITGVPLLLVTYGGSSILVTMAALGLLQSIYSRRFMF